MITTAKHVLTSMNIKDMVSLVDVDMSAPEKVPLRYGCRTRFLCGDTMSNWLWAYWQGKFQNLW